MVEYNPDNYDNYDPVDYFDIPEESPMDSTAGNVVAVMICVLGLIGNLMSIFVIIVLKEYKKTTIHLYALQLAIADALFLATIPFKIHQDNVKVWSFGVTACKAKETIIYLNYYASIFFLMVMSLDRYIAVCHSFSPQLRKLRTTFSAWIVIAGVWLLSFLVCIPVIMYVQVAGTIGSPEEGLGCTCSYMFPSADQTNYGETAFCVEEEDHGNWSDSYYYGDNEMTTPAFIYEEVTASASGDGMEASTSADDYNSNTTHHTTTRQPYIDVSDSISKSCNYFLESNTGWYAFIYVNFAILFVLPVVVMLVTYGFIIDKMRKSEAITGTTRSSSRAETLRSTSSAKKKKSTRNMTANKRITIMCTSLVGSFIALWLPFHAIHLAKINGINYGPTQGHICQHLTNMGTILGYLNSALNPYLYSFLGTNFVTRFKSARATVRQSVHSSEGRTRAVLFTRGNTSESGGYNVTLETRAGGGSKLVDSGSSNKGSNTIVTNLNLKSEHDQNL